MSHYILYTRRDRKVSICHPAPEAVRAFCNGGGWPGIGLNDLNRHIDAEIEAGRRPDLAMRFVHGLAFGGHTRAEAFEIIRDRDCADGVAHEIIHRGELPQSRWFRNAWRRSHNGGPIIIDMWAARNIQLRRIKKAAEKHRAELQLGRWRERIRRAESPHELRVIWPKGLPSLL
jgi:hypothetical protein